MSVPVSTLRTTIRVSWDGTGAFDGPHDDVTPDVPGDPGLTIDYGKDGARTLDPPKVASVDFELYNQNGKYSQERADSPIYQRVLPGRPIDVETTIGTTRAYRSSEDYRAAVFYRGLGVYQVASAAIDDISQTTGWGNQRVRIDGLGIEQVLVAGTVTVGLMAAPRVDQCVTAILDAIGWPSDARDISISDARLTYWWADDRDPWSALVELLRSEGPGAMYVERGVFHFEGRNYRATEPRSDQSQAVFFDSSRGASSVGTAYRTNRLYRSNRLYRGTTSGLWFAALGYDPGFRNIRNRATYVTRTRATAALGVVWSHGATVTLAPAQSVTLIARPSDPFVGAVTPTSPTDYTVSGGAVSVSMAASSGLVAFITLTATSGTPVVANLQLRAQALTVVGETTVQNGLDASASIETFSPLAGAQIPRVFAVDGWPEITVGQAEAVCDAWVSRYMHPRPAVEITLVGADNSHLGQILNRRISDRITLTERNTGLQADVWINGKTLSVTGLGGKRVSAVLRCERCEELQGFVWDGATTHWDSAIWGL